MQIVLVSDCYLPSTKSSAKLMHDLAAEYARCGHGVTLVTVSDSLDRPCETSKDPAGFALVRVRAGRTKGASRPVRAVNEFLLPWTIWRRARPVLESLAPSLIIYYSPTIFFGPLISRLKRLWGAKTYLILRDFFPDWAWEIGVLRNPLAYRFLKWREAINYRPADTIGVQSPANIEAFCRFNPRCRNRIDVVFNWADEIALPTAARPHRERLGLSGKIVFFYGGNIGLAQDMDNILRLAESLADHPEIYFLFVGDGMGVPRIAQQIAARKLGNCALLPAVGQSEYLEMLREFDVGLITLDRRLTSANIPGKLLSYLQCGIPTLASLNAGNDLGPILTATGAGLVSTTGDDAQFRANALKLARDKALRSAMGEAARNLLMSRFHVRAAAATILAGVAAEELTQTEAMPSSRGEELFQPTG